MSYILSVKRFELYGFSAIQNKYYYYYYYYVIGITGNMEKKNTTNVPTGN